MSGLGARITHGVVRAFEQMEESALKFQIDAGRGALHDLRVSIRRLWSLFEFAQACDYHAQIAKTARKRLKKLFKASGELRDIDTALEAYEERKMEGATHTALTKRRMELAKPLLSSLADPQNGGAIRQAVLDFIRVAKRDKGQITPVLFYAVFDELDGAARALCAELKALELFDIPRSHELRKRCKRVRYVAEMVPELAYRAAECKKAQRILGVIHDLWIWAAMLREYDEEARAVALKSELAAASRKFLDFAQTVSVREEGLLAVVL